MMRHAFLLAALALLLAGSVARASTYTVDDTGDADDDNAGNDACHTAGNVCTLRAAITESNAHSGSDTINFTISGGGAHTITLGSALPDVTGVTIIDGSTQSGAACGDMRLGFTVVPIALTIIVDASGGTFDIIRVTSGSTVKGLEVANTAAGGYGIRSLDGGNTIRCNYAHETDIGIFLNSGGAGGDTVGGGNAGDGNRTSNNRTAGIETHANTTNIRGNFTGVSGDGLSAAPNGNEGIFVQAAGVSVSENLISGNTLYGLWVDAASSATTVANNYIGVDATSLVDLCNDTTGANQFRNDPTDTIAGGDTFGCSGSDPAFGTPTPVPVEGCCNMDGANDVNATCVDNSIPPFNPSITSQSDCDGIGTAVNGTPGPYVAAGACSTPGDVTSACLSPTPTPAATNTPAPGTSTPTIAPTVAESGGACRATGDRGFLPAAQILTTSPAHLVDYPIVVPSASDPWFFLCNFVLFNQGTKITQSSLTIKETSGLFAPVTVVVEVPPATNGTYQIPFQTFGIAPGPYQIECLASAVSNNIIIAQPTSYTGAWRLGSSASGCPDSGGGNLDSSGATMHPVVCLDEEVATDTQATMSTTALLPAAAILDACVVRTNVAVVGGYTVGLAGALDAFGAAAGVVGDSNRLDVTMSLAGTRIVTDEAVTLTSAHVSGEFQNTTGRIRVVCFCRTIGAPTE